MKIFEKIFEFFKKGYEFLKNLFKDKKPNEIINDATEAIGSVATAAVAIGAGVNVVKSLFITGKKKKSSKKSKKNDSIREHHGDVEGRLRQTNSIYQKKTTLTDDEMMLLDHVAEKRNGYFRSLTPEEKMQLLEIEQYDIEGEIKRLKNQKKSFLFGLIERKSERKCGQPCDMDSPWREEVDYGWLNFIMRPLDDFILWMNNEPTPKKVKQVQIFDKNELAAFIPSNSVSTRGIDEEQIIIDRIYAEEMFRSNSLKKTKKRVNNRMINAGQGLSKSLFDMMDDEIKEEKKKKKKKKAKKNSTTSYYNFFGDSYSDDDDSDKKKKKKKKDRGDKSDKDLEKQAAKYAKEMLNYHISMAANGQTVHKGYKMR